MVNPPALFSQGGSLTVNLSYETAQDVQGRTLYCFTTPDGTESPTLHLHPGDHLKINVKNDLPAPVSSSSIQMATNASLTCGSSMMNTSSVNIHYHGTNVGFPLTNLRGSIGIIRTFMESPSQPSWAAHPVSS